MTPTSATASTAPFSEHVRAATQEVHRRAEASPFVRAFVAGELDVEAYAGLVDQHWHIYAALESTADALRHDPVAGPFVDDALRRVPALEADLAALRGDRWRDVTDPLPATEAYAERIRSVALGWPGGFVAHHYTRYLGDLSGGRLLGRIVARCYGLDGPGASFYRFDRIPDVKAFKAAYRARLDAAPLDAAERAAVVDEIAEAYRANTAVFDGLAARHSLDG